MTRDTKIIWGFYISSIILTIISGMLLGFTDSHTPPVPILLGLFLFLIGAAWTTIDLLLLILMRKGTGKAFIAHACGLFINGFYIYYLASLGIIDNLE